jgi:phage-related protein
MRTLSPAIQAAIAQRNSVTCHLLSFSVGTAAFYFAEDHITFQGNTYVPHLILGSPITYNQTLQSKPVTVKLQNVSLEIAAILKTQQSAIQGVEVALSRLFLSANEAVTLFVGIITQVDIDEQTVTLTLDGDLDPTASTVPTRNYSQLCMWNFKDSNCGYSDESDPNDPITDLPFAACNKTFLECQARGRQQRFPGFVYLTANLTQAVQGQSLAQRPPVTLSSILTNPWETP